MPNDRQYEFVYVLAPTVANAEVEALQRELAEHIGKLGGAVESTDLWGRRKLAYPIGNFTEGIYAVQLIRGPGAMVTELERRMRVHDDVLRYLTVRVDDDLRKAQRAAAKRKADAERRRAARGPRDEPSPPAPRDEPSPPAPRDEPSPPAPRDEPSPPAPRDEPSPPAPRDEPSPPAGPAGDAAADGDAPPEVAPPAAEAAPPVPEEAAAESEPAEALPSGSEKAPAEPPAAEPPAPAAESDEPAGA